MRFSKLSTRRNAPTSVWVAGFGLIELMVSISIITLVSAVILSRHTSFNGAVLLRNQAFEVAFAVRQAQILAVSGSTGTFGDDRQYGVYVNPSSPTTYILFKDGGNGEYDGPSERFGTDGRLDSRFEIREIIDGGGSSVSGLSISFVRPNFDAIFTDTSGNAVTGPVYIDIAQVDNAGNDPGDVRRVEITSSGQVQVTSY
jgi:type II secretory pathway pseudopilin PulG